MATGSNRGLRSDASRNYSRILDAAAQAFEQKGRTVSLDEIATRAGVGVATLYRRFRTREELIAAVAEHVFAADVATAVIEGGADPWTDLVATLSATVDAFAAHPVLVGLVRESAVFDLSAKSEYLAAIDRVLDRARDAGVIRPELTVDDVNAIVVMTLTMLRRGGSENGRRYLALLVDGMRPIGHRLPELKSPGKVRKRRKRCDSR
ncbi:MAG TPA: TetR family transcriptional regulator [Mycobacterium sp.]|jgi:AcrR family transcriptional regulator|nr:TetR family transcriptional regulator [Mycobacterium sp.]